MATMATALREPADVRPPSPVLPAVLRDVLAPQCMRASLRTRAGSPPRGALGIAGRGANMERTREFGADSFFLGSNVMASVIERDARAHEACERGPTARSPMPIPICYACAVMADSISKVLSVVLRCAGAGVFARFPACATLGDGPFSFEMPTEPEASGGAGGGALLAYLPVRRRKFRKSKRKT